MRFVRKICSIGALLGALLALPIAASAQTEAVITGVVTDSSGGVLPHPGFSPDLQTSEQEAWDGAERGGHQYQERARVRCKRFQPPFFGHPKVSRCESIKHGLGADCKFSPPLRQSKTGDAHHNQRVRQQQAAKFM